MISRREPPPSARPQVARAAVLHKPRTSAARTRTAQPTRTVVPAMPTIAARSPGMRRRRAGIAILDAPPTRLRPLPSRARYAARARGGAGRASHSHLRAWPLRGEARPRSLPPPRPWAHGGGRECTSAHMRTWATPWLSPKGRNRPAGGPLLSLVELHAYNWLYH